MAREERQETWLWRQETRRKSQDTPVISDILVPGSDLWPLDLLYHFQRLFNRDGAVRLVEDAFAILDEQ